MDSPPRQGYAARHLPRRSGFSAAVVLALAVGMGLGLPVLEMVRRTGLRSAPYTDRLLGEGETTGWLPGGTVARQTIPAIQDEAFRTLRGVLLALALLLLATALVNAVALLLARAEARRPEAALRTALGAGPWRLAGHLLGEGAVLLGLGAVLGLLAATGAVTLFERSWPGETPPWADAPNGGWSPAVVGVALLVPLLACLSPAGVAWRRDLRKLLATGGRATAGRGEIFTRHVLSVVQIAASVILLTGATLLLRGFTLSPGEGRDLGFDPRDTLTVQVHLSTSPSPGSQEQRAVQESLRDRIAALPGVLDASVSTPGAWLGLGHTDRVTAICRECWEAYIKKPAIDGRARIHAVSPGFFQAMGATVLRGRELRPSDDGASPRVAVINETAYRLFPHGDPLGKSIRAGGSAGAWYTIVGIVKDIRAPGIGSGAVPVPAVYLSTLQHDPSVVNLAVRASGDPMQLLPAVEDAVHTLAPEAKLSAAMTMEQYLARFRAPLRWFAWLFAILAGGALLMAASGLHSVMAYNVERRGREIGIRTALGATERDIVRMILGQSLRITGIGVALSLFGALALARVLQELLHGVRPFDPLLFGGTAALLGSVALLAACRPARRAASADPQAALRTD